MVLVEWRAASSRVRGSLLLNVHFQEFDPDLGAGWTSDEPLTSCAWSVRMVRRQETSSTSGSTASFEGDLLATLESTTETGVDSIILGLIELNVQDRIVVNLLLSSDSLVFFKSEIGSITEGLRT